MSHSNDNYLVTIHVDQAALQGKEGRSALPIETVKRICCNSHAVVLTETGYHSRDMLDTDIDTDTVEVTSTYSTAPAGDLLSAAENIVKEPPGV